MAADRRPDRQRELGRRLEELGLDLLLVGHPPNLRYLTGFTGSAGMLLMHRDRAVLITDSRYAGQAPAEARGAA
ncbi:MAG TPA: aminopeptidase P family N-terminal domain-containing protein, partial [Gemmatimonadales bacterium]|nr:aminopeptidase P family N-terminal domain-containing protein [Gemmatimonadales bacterium]